MFDLNAFDESILRRNDAASTQDPSADGGTGRENWWGFKPSKLVQSVLIVVASIAAALLVWTLIQSEPVTNAGTMMYNGMTLVEFARDIGMTESDPFVVALFEELCMTT